MKLFLVILLGVISLLFTPVTAHAKATLSQKEIIQRFSNRYGVNSEHLSETIKCESEFNPNAWNKEDPYGGARGIGQFLQSTFDRYAKKVGIYDPNIWDQEDSIQVMAYMFSIGEARQWTCWRTLYT